MKRLLALAALAFASLAYTGCCNSGGCCANNCTIMPHCDRCGIPGCDCGHPGPHGVCRSDPSFGGGRYAYTNACSGYGNSPNGGEWPTVGYPYYTTRGPRDYFANNPPSIGR